MKVKIISRKKILAISIFIISFLMIPLLNNININQTVNNYKDENSKKNDLFEENLKTQDLASDNTFTGIGAPWNVTHYANGTKTNLAVNFNNNSYDTSQQMELYGWNGYQLNSTIKNLYDTRNWINGTFHCGTDNGFQSSANDDSQVFNWTFDSYDDTGVNINTFAGNYYDSSESTSDFQDCVELRVNGPRYDVGDKAWWETNFDIDRGNVSQAWLSFAAFPKDPFGDQFTNHWVLQVIINNKILWGIGLASMLEACGDPSGQWYNPAKIFLDVDDKDIFPNDVKNMNITFEFKRVSGLENADYQPYYTVLIDNVSLVVKSAAKPTQLDLQLNNKDVKDKGNYGEGYCGILGNWNGSIISSVEANFSTDYDWPLTFEDNGIERSYKIELETNLTLYVIKSTPESYYTADPDLSYQGSDFVVSNNSNTNWTSYAHMEIPTGYEETNITVEFPSDYNLTGVFFSLNPDSSGQTTVKKYENKKILNIPVSSITTNTNGFWKITAEAPNYCTEMEIYKNTTISLDNWELSNIFLSGDYINITAKINNSQLISGYIQQTSAQLQIRFPNGSFWTGVNQFKNVKGTGMVHFDPIEIPSRGVNYKVGDYQAIISWNNSYSDFKLNETGIIYNTFTVTHNSSLTAVDDYFSDVFIGNSVNLRVSFTDLVNNKPIEGANVYLINFTSGIQYFDDLDNGDYLLVFNTSGGDPGNNTITIYASHPSYEDDKVNITIEVIFHTSLTAEEYPSIEVPWNSSFTVHLNYTFTNATGIYGIEGATPIINTWNDDWSYITSGSGLYDITCNTSRYQVNTAPNLRIDFDVSGYESQTIIISIEIVERTTSITDIFINGDDCTINKTANVHSGDMANITVKYIDNDDGGRLIHDALVTLNGTDIGEIFDDNIKFYNLTFNSTKLDVGITFLNIIAQKDNYTSLTEKITINVYERETNYRVYFNGTVHNEPNPTIQLYKEQFLNITFSYNDTLLKKHIPGAIVDINGSGISKVLPEAFNNYSVLIYTDDLNQGVNFLTIFARKDGYEAHSVLIIVNIIQIETNLTLFIDGEVQPLNPSITRYPSETINVTVSYNRSFAKKHISGAIVDINGSGISKVLPEAFNNYSVLIDTDNLNQGANFLTIFARKDGYEPQTISLVIDIIQIETELLLFADGVDITSDPSINRYPGQNLNITITYNSSIAKEYIHGAIVDINGSGISKVLPEAFNIYSTLIDTDDLNQGPNFLTIYARKGGYEPQTISLVIQIIQIETAMQIYLNEKDKTLDPVFSLTIGQSLNFTVKYTDQYGVFISNATILLIGGGLSLDLIKDETFNQYYRILDTSELGIRSILFTIIAQKPSYQSISKEVTITVNSILAKISTISGIAQIEAETGHDVLLQIFLNDTIFGEDIINATVTYNWAYGQGELQDSNHDGIFEITLENVREGIHTITINAFAGANYEFESYVITLVVTTPTVSPGPDLSWLVYVLVGAITGLTLVFTLYQTHFKYPPMVRKIRKLKKKVRKAKKSKLILVNKREEIIQSHLQNQIDQIDLESFQAEKIDISDKVILKKEEN